MILEPRRSIDGSNRALMLGVAVLTVLLAVGFWGGIAYVAWHFVAKFW